MLTRPRGCSEGPGSGHLSPGASWLQETRWVPWLIGESGGTWSFVWLKGSIDPSA